MKGIAMAQWADRLQSNIFVNPPPLPSWRKISGALHLVPLGLMVGWLADEIQVNFKIFKMAVGRNVRVLISFNQPRYSIITA